MVVVFNFPSVLKARMVKIDLLGVEEVDDVRGSCEALEPQPAFPTKIGVLPSIRIPIRSAMLRARSRSWETTMLVNVVLVA